MLSIFGETVLSLERNTMVCVLRFSSDPPLSAVFCFIDSAVGRTAEELSVSWLTCTPACAPIATSPNALGHMTVKRKGKLHPVYDGITTCILPAAVGVLGTSGGTLGKE
jgi:hypothetical protein